MTFASLFSTSTITSPTDSVLPPSACCSLSFSYMASDTYPDTMTGLDMISDLPDSMLCHILSFLPTKEAIQTSVLSKRWVGLWLSVPTLDFADDDEEDYVDHVKFVFMVYAAIAKREESRVEKFSLKINDSLSCCHENVNIWVKAALMSGAQYLDLSLLKIMNFPSATMGNKTLVVLKLDCLSVNTIVTNGFPTLKVLHLNDVDFGDAQCLWHLLFGCPILEELFVDFLEIRSDDNNVTAGQLQSLNNLVNAAIRFCRPHIPLKWICKVKSLLLHEGWFPYFDFNCTFRNLTSLELHSTHYNWIWLIDELLRNCPNLQHFKIHHMDKSKQIDCEKWSQPQFVPECLSKHLKTCTLKFYQGWKCELHFLKYIMQNAKVLHIMRICSRVFSSLEAKHEVMEKLSIFPERSATCRIHLNVK